MTQEKSPARWQLVCGEDPGFGHHPEEVGGSPFDQSIELGVGLETSLESLDVSEDPLVSLMP